MRPRIYRYIVAYDGGTAPNPFGGWCTLAICKPGIRRHAEKGDWVIGFRSVQNHQVIYAMEVEEVLPFERYWGDSRFQSRRPGKTDFPDNFYRPDGRSGFIREENDVHNVADQATDVGGRHVLVARNYWYFGRESPPIPAHLDHLVHSGIGYVVHKRRRPDDVPQLVAWLRGWKRGMRGHPINARAGAAIQDICGVVESPRSRNQSDTAVPKGRCR